MHESIKEWYPRKSRYFTAAGQSLVKTVVDRHGHAACALVTRFSAVSTLMTLTLKDPELPKKEFLLILAIFNCSAHSKNEL